MVVMFQAQPYFLQTKKQYKQQLKKPVIKVMLVVEYAEL